MCRNENFFLFLNKELRSVDWFEKNYRTKLTRYLDLVALGTICDVVPSYQQGIISQG